MRRPIPLLLTTALALPVLSQEPTVAGGQRPVLTVKSAESKVICDIAEEFGHMHDLPALEGRSHYVLTVASDRVTAVRTLPGESPFMEIRVDPGGIMDLFADEIGEVKGMAQGLVVMAMTQQGFSAKEATKMVRAAFDFPYLLESATLVLKNDPDEFEFEGIDIEVSITAKPDNELGKTISRLAPSPAGVPLLPAAADKVMDMRFSIDPAAMGPLFDPFIELGLSFSYTDAESRRNAKQVWDDMMKLYDGGFAFTISNTMQMEGLYGFRDPEALAKLVGSEDYLEMMRSQRPSRDIEVEVTAKAFEHRGITFSKMTMYNDGMPNPMMPNDEMHSFFGGLGSYMILGGSAERAKSLADAIADQKIEREQLDDGAVMAMKMDLRGWFEAVRQSMPIGEAAKKMPREMSMRLIPKGLTLTAEITAK